MSKRSAKPRSGIAALSFVGDRPKGEPGFPRKFWIVADHEDSGLGRRLALEYLEYEEADHQRGGPGLLANIVADMPRDLRLTEIEFLTLVAYAAAVGRREAVRVNNYWDTCEARREGAAS